MNNIKNKEKDVLNHVFISFCADGKLEQVKALYQHRPPKEFPTNSFHKAFLAIQEYFKPSLDLHCNNDLAISLAALNKHTHILDFLLNVPHFNDTINENLKIYEIFTHAVGRGDLDIAKQLHPYIKEKGEDYFIAMFNGFSSACETGQLESVKYVLTDEHLLTNNNWQQNDFNICYGFSVACRGGHLEIVRYLMENTELFSYWDIRNIPQNLKIENLDVMRFFIFDKNLERNHEFIQKIDFTDKKLLHEMFEKRDLYNSLNNKLENIEQKTNKRLKI